MSESETFYKKIDLLNAFLQSEGKNLAEGEEIAFLQRNFYAWMSIVELTGLLWEYRFDAFLKRVLALCENCSVEELKALARQYYLEGLNPESVAKEHRRRNLEKLQRMNGTVPPGKAEI